MTDGFRLGAVISAGFRVWLRNLAPFLFITLLVFSPLLLWGVLTVQGEPPIDVRVAALERFSSWSQVLVPLLDIVLSAALVYGVVMELSGQHASFARCLGTGLACFFPVVGVALLTMLAVIGGLILLIVPGFIILCALYVTTQVAVIERPGVFGALARSRELTAGHRWELFAIVIGFIALTFVLTKLIEVSMVDVETLTEDNFHEVVRRVMYVDLARTVVTASLSSVMASAAYYYLRREKEGTSAGELARVFE
jgi:uncharacterized membrane protein